MGVAPTRAALDFRSNRAAPIAVDELPSCRTLPQFLQEPLLSLAPSSKHDSDRHIQALLYHIDDPSVDIELLFRKVRDTVMATTKNAQEPFTYGSLPGEQLYLKIAATH